MKTIPLDAQSAFSVGERAAEIFNLFGYQKAVEYSDSQADPALRVVATIALMAAQSNHLSNVSRREGAVHAKVFQAIDLPTMPDRAWTVDEILAREA